jgi:hypothetical protein
VPVLMDLAFIASENFALMLALGSTSVAPLAGTVVTTVGAPPVAHAAPAKAPSTPASLPPPTVQLLSCSTLSVHYFHIRTGLVSPVASHDRSHGSKHAVLGASPKWTIFVCQVAIPGREVRGIPNRRSSQNTPYSITYAQQPANHCLPPTYWPAKGLQGCSKRGEKDVKSRPLSNSVLTDAVGYLPRIRVNKERKGPQGFAR